MAEPKPRPDPDELLRRLQADADRERRAKLKIFFGYAPGVGKTYAMLESARRLHEQGVDVVVGCAETHGREETAALLDGLEVLPRVVVLHRGTRLEELDLERALARHPKVMLLDELAHTNAPGQRHAKRYQDVLELLDAGVDVHTTLNVQHVESLNDVVAQITTIRVRETVPDALLDRADELELVDLPPEALLARLREGKIYFPEQAERAADRFFRRGNLLALRELALRRTADRVDDDVRAYREAHAIGQVWAAGERILVCVGPSPSSARLVRSARRMAAGLRAPWVAAYVEPSVGALSAHDRGRLDAHLRLAESLGGDVARLTGQRTSQALLEYARRHNVTRIIIGKPTHPRIRDLVRGSLLEEVVRGSGDIDVHVISGDVLEGPAPERAPVRERARGVTPWGLSVALVALATAVAALGRPLLAPADQVTLYLLVIMAVAALVGRGPALLASALSVAAYDFFFVPPFFTFAVSETRHVLSFAMMFGVGVLVSGLTQRIRLQERSARAREQRSVALYGLSRELSTSPDERHAAAALCRHAASLLEGGAMVLLKSPGGQLAEAARQGDVPFAEAERAVAEWVAEHGRAAGAGTDTLPGARILGLALGSAGTAIGVLALSPPAPASGSHEERELLEAFVGQATLAIERARLAEDAKSAALRARTEELRSSLLSTVSHDLRTPLAAITGAGTALREDDGCLAAPDRAELLDTICGEAERLERLVTNLLDMTRLESGGIRVRREWVPLEELVGAALTRLEAHLGARKVTTSLPADAPLVSVDPVLFQQVLVNLLDNAAKHTPPETSVDIRAEVGQGAVWVEVADHGPGIPSGSEERLFEKFYRGKGAGPGGVGLGLAICRGIVEAHGGTIRVVPAEGAGACFRIELPLVGEPPSMPSPSAPSASTEAES